MNQSFILWLGIMLNYVFIAISGGTYGLLKSASVQLVKT
jgi:hypothetical protein